MNKKSIWLTSDTHFDHANILFYAPKRAELWALDDIKTIARNYKDENREFLKEILKDLQPSLWESVRRMNEGLIANWNSRVQPGDDVYHLGDFGKPRGYQLESILNRLNGRIYLIEGNHDTRFVKQQYVKDRMVWIKNYYELKIKDPDSLCGKHQKIILSHTAFKVWYASHRSSYALSGHSHGNLDKWHRERLSIDVGVDSEHGKYFPISYEEIKRIMQKKNVKFVDRHNKDDDR